MEHTTDRLFWTLTSVIVGALLLTVGIKAFPNVTSSALAPVQGVMKQADIGTKNADKADNQVINDALGKTSGNATDKSSTVDTGLPEYMQADSPGWKPIDRNQVYFESPRINKRGHFEIQGIYVPDNVTVLNLPSELKVPKGTLLDVGMNKSFNDVLAKGDDGYPRTTKDISIPVDTYINDGSKSIYDSGKKPLTITFPSTLASISPHVFTENDLASGSTINIAKSTPFTPGTGIDHYAVPDGNHLNLY